MKDSVKDKLESLIKRYPTLGNCRESVSKAYFILEKCFRNGGKILIAGNGGSAADAEHIVGELMKGFKKTRSLSKEYADQLNLIDKEMGDFIVKNLQGALPAIALDGHPCLSTAFINDREPLLSFAQQVNGYGREGDVLLAISTSGNSKNILYAAVVARAKDMKIIALTGSKESKLSYFSDICIQAPETETYLVQEFHLPIYHTLCLMLEDEFFDN